MTFPVRLSAVCMGCLFLGCAGNADQGLAVNQQAKPDEPRGGKKAAGARHALLVGVTKYDNPRIKSLKGPANDVQLMRDVLAKRPYAFPVENIRVLTEAAGAANRPTRANIEKEFKRLTEVAHKGDQILVLLGGHGSQQPDKAPFDELDGLDETFLPADAGAWDDKELVPNAIVDDELNVWSKNIVAKGAFLWVIMDSCHSGTGLRDIDGEVAREVPVEDLVPKMALQQARALAAKRVKGEAKPFEWLAMHPRLVGLYASQASEPTVEGVPHDGSTNKTYGLLTHSLCQILTQAHARLTYRELGQRLRAAYSRQGRTLGPNPLVDGLADEQDREILGVETWPGRSRFTLRQDGTTWKIDGGALHGLTEGSILEVYPPAGEVAADKPVGHVRIEAGHAVEAEVEPCEFNKMPAPKDLPQGGRVELVAADYGSLALKVGIDLAADASDDTVRGSDKELEILAEELGNRAKDKLSLFQLLGAGPARPQGAPPGAEWLLQKREGKIILVAGDAARRRGKLSPHIPRYGPYSKDKVKQLQQEITQIARAQNLLRLTKPLTHLGAVEEAKAGPRNVSLVNVDMTMLKFKDRSDKKGEPLTWQGEGIVLKPGDFVGWVIKNPRRVAVDVTLLNVDSQFGIHAVFPQPGTENRLEPKDEILIGPVPVTSKTLGWEHLVLIAVRGDGPPVDFLFLTQPTLELARGDEKTRGARGLDSQLGKLFQEAAYAQRSFGRPQVDNYFLDLLSYQVVESKKKDGQP